MDRKTIIGLVLIGAILSVFAIFNKPSAEEVKKAKIEQAKAKEIKDAQDKATKEAKDKKAAAEKSNDTLKIDVVNWIPKLDGYGVQLGDSIEGFTFTNSISGVDTVMASANGIEANKPVKKEKVIGEIIQLQTNKLIIDFDTKGGQIASVRLKEYETFDDFVKNDGKTDPLLLFDRGDASQGLAFPMGENLVNTADELFEIQSQTNSKIVFELKKGEGSIEFAYELQDNAYDIGFDINIRGFQGKVSPEKVMYKWDVAYRKTERIFSEQRRVSTVCYNYEQEGFSYLSEMATDNEPAEDNIDWVCYKQSYFSSFLKPERPFGKSGSSFKVKTYDEGSEKDSTHLKDFASVLNLDLRSVENASVHMDWFFGPNDYDVLNEYDASYNQVLNYGWGIFRWINLYAVQPIFKLLGSTGLSIGICILILTILIKGLLMPIQWKMYTSSAKMRILKPEIEEIAAKYPEKADAMKKQMETMALYRESGASPMAGCVPMLIQMPILLAVFRFFPSTFDLRQQSFLWAEDLSSYDSIATLPWNVPIYGDHVSLFTLLMAITTLFYTRMNSSNMQSQQTPGMPNMKVIMYFFPIMMIFFFNNYSSGLSYYYFVSTLTSILIMLLIKKFFVDEVKIKAKMAERKLTAATAGTKTKQKSKFQQRLEKMQQAQQDQIKNKKK